MHNEQHEMDSMAQASTLRTSTNISVMSQLSQFTDALGEM